MVPRVFLSGKEHVGVCTEGMAGRAATPLQSPKEHVGVCTEDMAKAWAFYSRCEKEHFSFGLAKGST